MVLDQFSGVWNSLLSMLDSIPEDSIAVTVYGLGTLIILWCWTNIARRILAPVGAISWIIVLQFWSPRLFQKGQMLPLRQQPLG